MLEVLKTLFAGRGPEKEEAARLAAAGALIVDVRSPSEFAAGNIPGSLNVPVEKLPSGLAHHAKGRPLIVCCASGMRSAVAKRVLEKAGHENVANAGSWSDLRGRLGAVK